MDAHDKGKRIHTARTRESQSWWIDIFVIEFLQSSKRIDKFVIKLGK